MHIVTDFTRKLFSKIASKIIKHKTGYETDILLNKLDVTYGNGKMHVHLDLDAEMSKEELLRITKGLGIK